MLDKPKSKISKFQVRSRIERVYDPHLILRSTRRDVEALLGVVVGGIQIECAVGAAINQRKENNVTLVSLKMRRRATEKRTSRVFHRWHSFLEDRVNEYSLFVAK